jgi:hypothetical protein
MVENATREKVASLRIDNGGEFNDYFRDNRIKRQLKNSYTSQQNGVTERMRKTHMGMGRYMM